MSCGNRRRAPPIGPVMKNMTIVCALLISGVAAAQADVREKGTRAIRGDVTASVDRMSSEGDSSTGAAIGVTGAHFVADSVSVGATLRGSYRTENNVSQTALGVIPTVGYAARIGERVYLWPQVGVGVAWAWINSRYDSFDGSARLVVANAYIPVYLEPAEHLLVGFGPAVTRELSMKVTVGGETTDGPTRMSVGAIASLVGWF
jgi:hypothetical protein